MLQVAEPDNLKVGLQPDGRILVPTNQILQPAGTQITFPGRPVDLVLADDGKTLVVLNLRDLVFIDVATAEITQTLTLYLKESPEPVMRNHRTDEGPDRPQRQTAPARGSQRIQRRRPVDKGRLRPMPATRVTASVSPASSPMAATAGRTRSNCFGRASAAPRCQPVWPSMRRTNCGSRRRAATRSSSST